MVCLLVDNVDNTVSDEHVAGNNTGAVHEDASSVTDGNGQLLAVQSCKNSAVLEGGAVAQGVVDNVVSQHIGELLHGEVGESGSDTLEGGVRWRKDGQVGGVVHGIDELSRVEGSTEGRETSSGKSVGSVDRYGEKTVDDVDDTTCEVNVLFDVSCFQQDKISSEPLTGVVTVELFKRPLKIVTLPLLSFAWTL